mgnify:CR=1 FL=1
MRCMKKSPIKKSSEGIKKIEKIKKVIDNTQKVVGDVENITKIISSTLYIRGNVAVDMQNYSLISISNPKDII